MESLGSSCVCLHSAGVVGVSLVLAFYVVQGKQTETFMLVYQVFCQLNELPALSSISILFESWALMMDLILREVFLCLNTPFLSAVFTDEGEILSFHLPPPSWHIRKVAVLSISYPS